MLANQWRSRDRRQHRFGTSSVIVSIRVIILRLCEKKL